jgi:hypothetical protein
MESIMRKMSKEDIKVREAIRERWYIMKYGSKAHKLWQILIIILATYNAIFAPARLGFKEVKHFYDTRGWLNILELVADIFFIIDIILGFFTSFWDITTGDMIFNPKLIARKYLLTFSFIVDVLSSLPLFIRIASHELKKHHGDPELIETLNEYAKLLTILKIARLSRLNKLVRNLNIEQQQKYILRLMVLVMYLLIAMHLMACLLWFLTRGEKIWIPPLDFIYLRTDLYELKPDQFFYLYFKMLYHAVLVFAMVDIAPRGLMELGWLTFLILVSALATALIYGELAVIIDAY